jgi:hypothetical protein
VNCQEYGSTDTDVPHMEDLAGVEIDDLRGKKISFLQAQTLK